MVNILKINQQNGVMPEWLKAFADTLMNKKVSKAEAWKIGTEALAAELAKSLTSRELMLRLLSANLYDLEDNSRIERLTEFKRAYFKSTEAMDSILAKQFHGMSEKERRLLLLTLFEFIHGVYPYAYATPKQKKAMDEVGVRYGEYTLYELTYEGMKRILKSAEEKEK